MLTRLLPRLAWLRDIRGTSALEFALVAPIFFLAMFGTVDFGRAMWAYSTIESAATEGARYAAIRGSNKLFPATASQVKSFVVSRAYALDVNTNQVTVAWNPDNDPGSQVTVQVAYNFSFLMIGFLPLPPIELETSSTLTVH